MCIDINLNIHHSAPQEIWDRLGVLYQQMPGWPEAHPKGTEWFAQWFGPDGAERFLSASVEPGGLQIYGQLPEAEWTAWITEFKRRAEEILGYPVGEPEDGFAFHYYDED